jgi:nucleotide-binding universal stress UspA family protein
VFGLILAGTDGSERAEEALRQAARLASTTGGTLMVAYVIDTGRPHDADLEGKADVALQRAESICTKENVPVTSRVLAGDPAGALVEEASDHGTGLICIGPDAGVLGGAIRVGHVAAHVLRHAGCSVMVGREAGPDFPSRVQCGVDGSESSVLTARLAARIAAAAGAELRLQHVITAFRGDDQEWTLDEDEPSPAELEPAVAAAHDAGANPIREMAMGRPEYAIVETTRRDHADLVVVGHRGLTGPARLLLGSVSEYVATHAHCSVLVARTATRPE